MDKPGQCGARRIAVYERLFMDPNPGAGGEEFLEALNANNQKVMTAYMKPSLGAAKQDE